MVFNATFNNISVTVKTCLSRTSFGTEEFVQFRQVFDLHRFILHSDLVDWTVKSVCFMQVFGLLRVRFRQVSFIGGGNRNTRRKPQTTIRS